MNVAVKVKRPELSAWASHSDDGDGDTAWNTKRSSSRVYCGGRLPQILQRTRRKRFERSMRNSGQVWAIWGVQLARFPDVQLSARISAAEWRGMEFRQLERRLRQEAPLELRRPEKQHNERRWLFEASDSVVVWLLGSVVRPPISVQNSVLKQLLVRRLRLRRRQWM